MTIRINYPYDEEKLERVETPNALFYRFKFGDTHAALSEDALYNRRIGFGTGVIEAARAFMVYFTQKRVEREFDAESIRNMKIPEAS